jgi:hypothetical protein
VEQYLYSPTCFRGVDRENFTSLGILKHLTYCSYILNYYNNDENIINNIHNNQLFFTLQIYQATGTRGLCKYSQQAIYSVCITIFLVWDEIMYCICTACGEGGVQVYGEDLETDK